MIYPPIGQLAVAAAEAGLVGWPLVSSSLLGSSSVGIGVHGDDDGDEEVVDAEEQMRAVAYETLLKNLIAPLPYRIWRGGVSEACSPDSRVRGDGMGSPEAATVDGTDRKSVV